MLRPCPVLGPARTALLCVAALALAACSPETPAPGAAAPEEVNVYSTRHYAGDDAVFAAFTEATGIEVNVVDGLQGDQLIERLRAEGEASVADVLITVDAGNLWRLEQQGFLQPVRSAAIEAAVPANLRHPEGLWFAFSKRARVIAYAPERIAADAVATYDALAAPALKGRVCARSSSNVYNLSLLAARIERDGAPAAEAWARGVAGNLARPPQGGDTEQLRAVASGLCDAAIVNHYYFVRLAQSEDPADREAAAKLALSFPDQAGAGAHVNVSGAALARHAPHPEAAQRLLEFMVEAEGQRLLAALNEEFPVRAGVAPRPELAALPAFKEDDTPLAAYGARQAEAQAVYDRVGWR